MGPKPPPDVGRDHPDLMLRKAERVDQDALRLVRHLGGVPDRQQILGRRRSAPRPRAAPWNGRRPCECASAAKSAVPRPRMRSPRRHRPRPNGPPDCPDSRAAPWGHRARARRRIEHRRQRLEVERDQAGRVLGQAAALRHHHRDRLAREAQLPRGQRIGVHMKPDGRDRQRERDAVAAEQGAQIPHRSAPPARPAARAPSPHRCRAGARARPGCARRSHAGDPAAPGRRRSGRAAQQVAILEAQHRAAAKVAAGRGHRRSHVLHFANAAAESLAGLVPATHVLGHASEAWVPGTRPGMIRE